MIPTDFQYHGWHVLVFSETGCTWMSTAIKKSCKQLYADGGRGKGSKQRAHDKIISLINEKTGGYSEPTVH